MKLYHATNGDNVPAILRDGLLGEAPDCPVHMSERDSIATFIHTLFDLGPGGFYEHETGHWDVAVTFEIDTDDLDSQHLDGPLADEFGPDNEEHHMYWSVISPECLKIVSVYRGTQE